MFPTTIDNLMILNNISVVSPMGEYQLSFEYEIKFFSAAKYTWHSVHCSGEILLSPISFSTEKQTLIPRVEGFNNSIIWKSTSCPLNATVRLIDCQQNKCTAPAEKLFICY